MSKLIRITDESKNLLKTICKQNKIKQEQLISELIKKEYLKMRSIEKLKQKYQVQ